MNSILVPSDFSGTARNAARYALSLAKQMGTKKILLYNAYQTPVIGDSMAPSLAMIDMESIQKISEEGLRSQKAELEQLNDIGIEIETLNAFNFLIDGIEAICENSKIDLIVVGITGASALEEALVGSNTVALAKRTTVPLIVVPANAVYQPIQKVLLACDFKKVIETTPIDAIRNIIGETKAKLHVVHVNHQGDKYSSETEHEIKMLDSLLQGLNPEYAFVENNDFTEAINKYVEDNSIDLIITIPKKHGLFEGLFKKSHAKMLAFHSHVPLMSVHE
jgi:nucleotide-binding universal stress UspA family protein